MHEALAVAAGVATGGGVFAAFGGLGAFRTFPAPGLGGWRASLTSKLERAGVPDRPGRILMIGVVISLAACIGFGVIDLSLAPLGLAAGPAGLLMALNGRIEARRRRIQGDLVPLLELFTLELSGGGSALSALGSVTVQVDSQLAADLRQMLIASQVAGSPSFEARLIDYAERMRVPALGSLATVLGASREFGTGASQGVRALATDLRRAQRRELIAHGRRALNRVLLPAALFVLLPFLAVLMFPAVSALQEGLR